MRTSTLVSSLLAVLTLVICTADTQAALLAHWKLDDPGPVGTLGIEEVGTITQPNPVANRLQGTVSFGQGSAAPSLGTGIDFGQNGEMFIDNIPEFNALTSNFTVSTWVNPRDFSNSPKLIAKHNGSGGTAWSVGTNAAGQVSFTTLGVADHFAGVNLTANQWQHLTITVADDAGLLDIDFFLDGQKLGSIDNAAPMNAASGANWFIGGIGAGRQSFRGSLDDVKVFDNVLSQAEISALAELPDLREAITVQSYDYSVTPNAHPNFYQDEAKNGGSITGELTDGIRVSVGVAPAPDDPAVGWVDGQAVTIDFNFDGLVNVDEVQIGYAAMPAFAKWGPDDVDILVSTDGGATFDLLSSAQFELLNNIGGWDRRDLIIDLGGVMATNIALSFDGGVLQNTGNFNGFILDEVTFFAAPAVPEPTTALLGLLGMAGLAARRRRTA